MLHEGYHRDIAVLKEDQNLPSGRLFTYVDADDFADPEEEIRMMTTRPDKPSFLTEKMREIRKRHGTRQVEVHAGPPYLNDVVLERVPNSLPRLFS